MSISYAELRAAVLSGKYDDVQALLDKGADVNMTDTDGETVLHIAMRISSATDVMQLLGAGADTNHADAEGVTPFMAAVNATKFANAAFAIDYKADVNFQPRPDSMPPLYRAMSYDTMNGVTERTAFLLKQGANIDAVIVQPDGSVKSLIKCALDFDAERNGQALEKLIKNHLNRDIRAEFNAAVARKSMHEHIVSVLGTHRKNDSNRYRLG